MSDPETTPPPAPVPALAAAPGEGPRPAAGDPITDGAWHRLDPRYVDVERIGRWIVTCVVSFGLFLHLLSTLFADEGRFAITAAADAAVLALLAWWSFQWPAIAYRRASYRLDDRGIEIRRGVIWRRAVVVPRSRVQHTDVAQGPVQRLYGLGTLIVHTAGTEHAKVELPGLSHALAMRIRDHLLPAGGDDAV
ncbi:MAG: PH domain-containing protein [Vicinamibacterales bacterium]